MHDHDNDDDALAGIDLAAWQPPAPPADLADAVIARLRRPARTAAVEAPARSHRRFAWLAAVTAVAAGLVIWDVTRGPGRGGGELLATGPTHLAPDGAAAEPARPPRREPVVAGGAPEPARVEPPASAPDAAPASGRTVRAERKCGEDIVAAEIEMAARQFSTGNPRPALFLMLHVLDCKQDPRLVRIAAIYACAASDEPIARMLFKKLTAEPYRSAVEQKCLQEGIDLTKP